MKNLQEGGNTQPESRNAEIPAQAGTLPEVDVEAERKWVEQAWFDCNQNIVAFAKAFAARTQADAGRDTARLNALIDWYCSEGLRAEIHPTGHIEVTTREHVIAWCDTQSPTTTPENT